MGSYGHINGIVGRDEGEKTIPIAIVGMSFQFADDATTAETLWSMLMEGRCASKDFLPDRLNGAAVYHPDRSRGDSVSFTQNLVYSQITKLGFVAPSKRWPLH
jgi:acyl transferase domain-containing protein